MEGTVIKIKKQLVRDLFDTLKSEISSNKQKEYILSLITLKVLETKDNKFDVPYDCMWSKIISNGKDLGKRLNVAFKKIEKVNSDLQKVFKYIEFTKISDATLHKLSLQINQLSINTNLSEVADEVLLQSAALEGRKSTEYITPKSISNLMIQLLEIQDDSKVLDPTAGTGQFLNDASNVAKGLSLYGQEKNEKIWAIGKMNAILHKNEESDFRIGDTIRNPQFKGRDGLETFDYVVMHPPYSLNNWGYEEAQGDIYGRFFHGIPPKSNGDMAFILHALSSLNEKGKAAVIIPHGVLFRGATEGKIRQKLIEADVIEAVIGLPSGLLYSSSIPVAILMLNKDKRQDQGIFFIQADEQFQQFRNEKDLGESDIKKIVETFRARKEIDKFSRWVACHEIKDFTLNLLRYFEEDRIETAIGTVKINKYKYEKNETVPLKNTGRLFRGMNIPKENNREGEYPTHLIIELSDVQNGELVVENLTSISLINHKNIERYELKSGDIILSSRGSTIKIAVIPETDGQLLLLSNHFIGIRPIKSIHPEFLKAFLESPMGMFYLLNNQKGSTVSVLTTKDIQDIPVPNLTFEEQKTIGQEFVHSNQVYLNQINEAVKKHNQEYESLYHRMGISSAYNKLD